MNKEFRAKVKEKSEKIIYFLFFLLIPASIFRVNASIPGFESFFLFRVVLFLIIVSIGLTFLFNKELIISKLNNLKRQKYVLGFFILWFLASLTSYFWIIDLEKYIRYNVLLLIGLSFLFILVFFIQDKKTLEKVWKILLLTLLSAVVIGLLEIFTSFRLPGSTLLDEPKRFQELISSFFHHPNDFASYVSLSLPFIILAPLYKEYKKYKWLFFIFAVTTAFVLTFTGSRLIYITNLVSLFLSFVILLKEHKLKQILPFSAIVIVAIFSVAPYYGPTISSTVLGLLNREVNEKAVISISREVRISKSVEEFYEGSGSITVRKNLISNSFVVLKDNPEMILVGSGAGQIEKHMEKFDNTNGIRKLHNWWLEVLTDHGIFIFFGYVVLYLWVLKGLFKKALSTKDGFLKYMFYSLTVILIVFIFSSVSPSLSVGFAPLWLTLGLAIAANNIKA